MQLSVMYEMVNQGKFGCENFAQLRDQPISSFFSLLRDWDSIPGPTNLFDQMGNIVRICSL